MECDIRNAMADMPQSKDYLEDQRDDDDEMSR